MWTFLLFLSASALTCPTYSCHEGGFSISPTCAMVSPTNNIILQICDNQNQGFCNIQGTLTNNYTCQSGPPPYPSGNAYPGEFCFENSNCITNLCESNTCVGKGAGYACVKNADCDVGFYCGRGFFCTPQLVYGQPCTNDYQCANQLACNRTLFESGTCIYYYSIPNGQPVGMCQDMLTEGYSNLCQTGACRLLNPGFDTIGICQAGYHLPLPYAYPYVCEQDSDCIGWNGATTTIGTCSCGMDMNGLSYCDSFSEDPPAMTVQLIWELHVNSTSINACHTQRRFDMFCLRQNLGPSAVQNFINNRALATDTARYQGNDYCTKAIFNNQFFNVGPANFGCQAYGCGNSSLFSTSTCISFAESVNQYQIVPCPSGSSPFCDFTQAQANKWTNVTCGATPPAPMNYPGDPCSTNTQCLSGVCSAGVCQGVGVGGSCSSSQNCSVGLFCVSQNYHFTCQPQIQATHFGCGSDYDCVNYAGCNFGSSGPPGTCVAYFSLAQGASVPCPKSGISYLCSSGACYSSGNSFLGTCTAAPVSSKSLPVACTFNGQCTGNNTLGQKFQGSCTCGYNTNGTSYCSVFSGDAPGQTYFKTLKKFLKPTTAITSCQTTRRFSQDCFNIVANSTGTSNSTWYVQMLNFTMYPYFINNDPCVKSVYTSNFWSNVQIGHGEELKLDEKMTENSKNVRIEQEDLKLGDERDEIKYEYS